MGVLDILPNAISGVYFIYDPDYSALSPGKLSALRECSLAAELEEAGFGQTFYMMGYYIHSCQKMRYKAEYSPSYLLDPSTNHFLPFKDTCEPILEEDNHAIFSEYLSGKKSLPKKEQQRPMVKLEVNSLQADTGDSDSSEEAGEDEDERLRSPPPPGFLPPSALPKELLLSVYGFDRGTAVPLIMSRAWRTPSEQIKLREGIAALGAAAEETCLFV